MLRVNPISKIFGFADMFDEMFYTFGRTSFVEIHQAIETVDMSIFILFGCELVQISLPYYG